MLQFLPMLAGLFGGGGAAAAGTAAGTGAAAGGNLGMGNISAMMSNQQNPPGLMTDSGTGAPGGVGGEMPIGDSGDPTLGLQGGGSSRAQPFKDMSAYNGIPKLLSMMNQTKRAESPRGRMDSINNKYVQGLMGG